MIAIKTNVLKGLWCMTQNMFRQAARTHFWLIVKHNSKTFLPYLQRRALSRIVSAIDHIAEIGTALQQPEKVLCACVSKGSYSNF